MEPLSITLNIENYHLIVAVIIMLGGLFGQPYLVREMNKKKLDLKADKTEMVDFEEKLEKKASCEYVNDKVKVLHHRVDESNQKQKENFELLIGEVKESRGDIKKIMLAMKIK